MRIKDLFTIGSGNKATEKAFGRVLASSICGILLCMACLIGTTWAWYIVGVENPGNVIEIATATAQVDLYQDTVQIPMTDEDSYQLPAGTYTAQITLENNATASAKPVYVLISVLQEDDTVKYYYAAFENGSTAESGEITVDSGTAVVSWSVSWIKPSADLLGSQTGTPATDEATQ